MTFNLTINVHFSLRKHRIFCFHSQFGYEPPPLPPVYLNIQEVNTFSTFQVQSEEHIAETEHTSDYYTNQ